MLNQYETIQVNGLCGCNSPKLGFTNSRLAAKLSYSAAWKSSTHKIVETKNK